MQTILIETEIAAPPERCFLLSLSIDLHMESTREYAIAGVRHGLIGLGETVTWRGRHFGLMLKHESCISRYDNPHYFQDAMVRGVFRSFVHDHFFESKGDGCTRMRDELRFAMPLGLAGGLVEKLILNRYLRHFLMDRNRAIRRVAEGPEAVWSRYVADKKSVSVRTSNHA